MSAAAAPFGFLAAKHPNGAFRANEHRIASGYAANLFAGDPVKLLTDGTIALGTSDGTRTGTVDSDLLGVFAGCTYVDPQGRPVTSQYWPTGQVATQIRAFVYDDPETVFQVQGVGSIAATALGDQANVAGFAAPGGSVVTGRSLASLSAVVGVGTQGQFRIVEFDRSEDNTPGDAFTKVLVQIARHQFRADKVAI